MQAGWIRWLVVLAYVAIGFAPRAVVPCCAAEIEASCSVVDECCPAPCEPASESKPPESDSQHDPSPLGCPAPCCAKAPAAAVPAPLDMSRAAAFAAEQFAEQIPARRALEGVFHPPRF